MTLLRMKELRALTDEELNRKLADIENDLLRERGIAAMGGAPPSPGRMRALRTNVARGLTIRSERLRAARSAPRPAAPPTPPKPAKSSARPKAPKGGEGKK